MEVKREMGELEDTSPAEVTLQIALIHGISTMVASVLGIPIALLFWGRTSQVFWRSPLGLLVGLGLFDSLAQRQTFTPAQQKVGRQVGVVTTLVATFLYWRKPGWSLRGALAFLVLALVGAGVAFHLEKADLPVDYSWAPPPTS